MQQRQREKSGAATKLIANATSTEAIQPKQTTEATLMKASQPIKQNQSTELLQTLLHALISAVGYQRDLFSGKCYDEQIYDRGCPQWSYDDYIASNNQSTPGRHGRGTTIRVLKRGRTKGADRLLDWLEKGAFDALKRQYLEAMQLQIFEDPDEPHKVLETYTFTIKYIQSSGSGDKTVAGLEMAGPNGQVLTVKKVKNALELLIRHMVELSTTFPFLGDQRRLRMYLFYTDDCPEDYQPPYFVRGKGTELLFPEDNEWTKHSFSLARVTTGYHNISLKISHVDHEDKEIEIPSGLNYGHQSSRFDDMDTEMLSASRPISLTQINDNLLISTDKQTSGTDVPSMFPGTEHNAHTQGTEMDLDDIGNVATSLSVRASVNNRSVQSAPHKVSEEEVTQHERPYLGGSSTQQETVDYLAQMPKESLPAIGLEETQLVEPATGSRNPPAPTVRQQLSQTKVDELKRKYAALQKSGSTDKEDIVNCQCSCNTDGDDNMIHCPFCNTWQHLHCYGYRTSDQVPDPRACYKCMLEEKEPRVLQELKGLALLRRAIFMLNTKGYRKDQELADELGCDLQTAARVGKHLRSEHYLVGAPGYKRRGFSQNFPGKRPYQITDNSSRLSEMWAKYFDPLFMISHHFVIPQVPIPSAGENTIIQLPAPPLDTQVSQVSFEPRKGLRPNSPLKTSNKSAVHPPSSTTAQPMSQAGSGGALTPTRKRRYELLGRRITPQRAAKKLKHFGMSAHSVDAVNELQSPYST